MKKGSKQSPEARLKMRAAALRDGRKPPPFKGKKHSQESIELMRIKQKDKVMPESWKENVRKAMKKRRGANNHFWKGGVTPKNMMLRKSIEYKDWRRAVFERDNYTCVFCGQQGGRLNADHIKRFADYPELRLDLDNGRTLCEPCHRKTPGFGRYAP